MPGTLGSMTHPASLLRAQAPDHDPPTSLGCPSVRGSVQVVARPCWALALPGPRLLVGDFNLPGAVARAASRWVQLARVATYPSYRPRVQLDHVFSHGIAESAVRDVQAMRLPVSDHCALRVDLAL